VSHVELLHCLCSQIEELEQARELGDKTELDELLDNARKEKDMLESQAALLQEQLSRSQCETTRLRDQLIHLQEECKVRPRRRRNDNVRGRQKRHVIEKYRFSRDRISGCLLTRLWESRFQFHKDICKHVQKQ
jgi:hypothetical protein